MIQKIPDQEGRPKRGADKTEAAVRAPRGGKPADEDMPPVAAEGDDATDEVAAAAELTEQPAQAEDAEPQTAELQADEDLTAEDLTAEPADAEGAEAEGADEAPADDDEPVQREPAGSGLPLPRRIEAVLFASGQSLSPVRLGKVLEAPVEDVKEALETLVTEWAERDTALEITAIAGGFRFMTRAAHHADLAGLARKGKIEKLSPAALETLAVVAYRQPINRADIEGVRGVAAGPLLRVLLDRDLIRIAGRSKEPGHPLLYGTTKRFLDHFGLKSLKQLPDLKDLLDVR